MASSNSSALELVARRAALRQTLESAMDVLDRTEPSQQHQQLPSASFPPMMNLSHCGMPMSSMNIRNPVLSAASLQGHPSLSFGNTGGIDPSLYGNSSCNSALFSAVAAEENRLLVQARAALIRDRMIANEEQQKHLMLSNFLQSKQQQQQSQRYGDNSTSVIQALMGSHSHMQGMSNAPMHAALPFSMYSGLTQKHAVAKNDYAILHALGNNTHNKTTTYIDVSVMLDPKEETDQRHLRGGVAEPFPEKLHRMLREVEAAGQEDIVSFYSHGRAFGIHDPEKFVTDILSTYFKQSKLNSFLRQLNLYGFIRIQSGPDSGGYYNALFLKQRPQFLRYMRRVGVPVKGEDRRKVKAGTIPLAPEPDFYSMDPVRPSATSA